MSTKTKVKKDIDSTSTGTELLTFGNIEEMKQFLQQEERRRLRENKIVEEVRKEEVEIKVAEKQLTKAKSEYGELQKLASRAREEALSSHEELLTLKNQLGILEAESEKSEIDASLKEIEAQAQLLKLHELQANKLEEDKISAEKKLLEFEERAMLAKKRSEEIMDKVYYETATTSENVLKDLIESQLNLVSERTKKQINAREGVFLNEQLQRNRELEEELTHLISSSKRTVSAEEHTFNGQQNEANLNHAGDFDNSEEMQYQGDHGNNLDLEEENFESEDHEENIQYVDEFGNPIELDPDQEYEIIEEIIEEVIEEEN